MFFLRLSLLIFISKQARSKNKMTGGAEWVAHINPPPSPASVPR